MFICRIYPSTIQAIGVIALIVATHVKGEESGASVYANCEYCHGSAGEGKFSSKGPKLAGLSAWYVKEQLQRFIDGTRGMKAADAFKAGDRHAQVFLRREPTHIKDGAVIGLQSPVFS